MRREPVVVITGTSRGIGNFLVKYFIEKGYIVTGCSRSTSTIHSKLYSHYTVDVSDEKRVGQMVSGIYNRFKRIDVAITNAGVASMNHSLLTPGATVDKLFDINFKGMFYVCRECAKYMKIRNYGRIVNFSSVAVPMNIEGESIYASSKSAVVSFSKIFAKEVAPFGITCNVIAPSPIETSLIAGVPKEKIEKIIQNLAIKRYGTFKDITNVIEFFIKKESSFITGQVIYLGGGG